MPSSKNKKQRWVIKAGSRMVCEGGPLLIRSWMLQLQELKKNNIEVIWVTSGAIAWARQRVFSAAHKKKNEALSQKQALSAIGQPLIMEQYNFALQSCGLVGAQILLTAKDLKNKENKKNLFFCLSELLKMGHIPILNENDAIATEEIQFGDNDQLASLVALEFKAQKLILLTDVDGYYDSDPKKNRNSKIIPIIKKVKTSDLNKVKAASKSTLGTGGIYSKLLAAQKANKKGIAVHLVKGDIPQNLIKLMKNESLGTRIGS